MYFVVLRPGNVTDIVVCHPNEIGPIVREMEAHVIGEGRTREEAWVDSALLRLQ